MICSKEKNLQYKNLYTILMNNILLYIKSKNYLKLYQNYHQHHFECFQLLFGVIFQGLLETEFIDFQLGEICFVSVFGVINIYAFTTINIILTYF